MKAIEKLKNKIPEKRRTQIKKGMKIFRIVKNIICWTLIAVLGVLMLVTLITRINGGTPSVFGYRLQRVETGSMVPELEIGEVILSKNVDDVSTLKAGDIITFRGGAVYGNHSVTHRVLVAPQKGPDGNYTLTTKGDANDVADAPIYGSDVESIMVGKLEFLKELYNFFLSPWGLLTFVGLLLIVFFEEIVNIVRILSGNYPDEDEEDISQIIERIQREDAEKEAKRKAELKRLKDYPEDAFEDNAELNDMEDPDPEEVASSEED